MTNPNEPTLTCSEVVERLAPTYAEISTFMQKFFGCDYNETHKFGFDEVTRVVYAFCQSRESDSWRERRVQELEEALRPFANFAGLIERDEPDDMHATFFHVRFGDVRKAAKVLNSEWREQIRKGAR